MARRTAPARRRTHGARWLLFLVVLGGLGGWLWFNQTKLTDSGMPTVKPLVQAPLPRQSSNSAAPNPGPAIALPTETKVPVPAPLHPNPPPAITPKPSTPAITLVATNLLTAQIALAAQGISCGSLDGVGGAQTAAALRAFQMQRGLEQTGWLDRDTQRELTTSRAPLTSYVVTTSDLARLAPVPTTWLAKSQAAALDYENLLELVAEQSHAHPNLLRRLNPSVNWETVTAGTELVLPQAPFPTARRANLVRVSLGQRWIRAFDGRGNLLAHFPCSIGRIAEKRPVGELHVAVAVKNPNYTFDPAVFPESAEGRELGRKLVIPPGPNNPVGVAWIGLDRPGYGIHGTPGPEQVGRTESHGCFRLANWNAEYLRQMVNVGTPVWIEP